MTTPDSQPDSKLAHSIERGHETRDASLHVAWIAKIGIAVLLAGALAAMLALSNWLTPGEEGGGTESQPVTIERGEVRMQRQRIEQQQRQRQVLSEYGWIDRPAGIARIPIDRAMELIAADPALLEGSSAEQRAETEAAEGGTGDTRGEPEATESPSEEQAPDPEATERPSEEPAPAAEATEGAVNNE